jgi:hypothetical protein
VGEAVPRHVRPGSDGDGQCFGRTMTLRAVRLIRGLD